MKGNNPPTPGVRVRHGVTRLTPVGHETGYWEGRSHDGKDLRPVPPTREGLTLNAQETEEGGRGRTSVFYTTGPGTESKGMPLPCPVRRRGRPWDQRLPLAPERWVFHPVRSGRDSRQTDAETDGDWGGRRTGELCGGGGTETQYGSGVLCEDPFRRSRRGTGPDTSPVPPPGDRLWCGTWGFSPVGRARSLGQSLYTWGPHTRVSGRCKSVNM